MSPRGRKAVLPPSDFKAPVRLDPTGLQVTVVNSLGIERIFDFTDLQVPEPMQRSLASAFARQSSGWKSHSTARNNWYALERFAGFLREQGSPAQDLGEVSEPVLKLMRQNFRQAAGTSQHLAALLRLLKHDPQLNRGVAAEELARPVKLWKSTRKSMDTDEHQQVKLAAQTQFRAALLRIRENTERLERYRAGDLAEGSRDWKIGRILEGLAATGDVPRRTGPTGTRWVVNAKLLGGRGPEATWGRLFLRRREAIALAVLMTNQWSWNLSMYDRMPVPLRTPSAGETSTVTYQVQVEKHRAGFGRWWDSVNITDSGAGSDGRLITQALEATAHGRALAARLAPGADLLMVYRLSQLGRDDQQDGDRPSKVEPLGFGVSRDDATDWSGQHGLSRSPFQGLRRTIVVDEGRPLQHKQGTHDSRYVLPDERVQRDSRKITAAGAQAAYQLAQDVTFKGKLAGTADPAHAETVTSDCAETESGPAPTPDGGCSAGFMACLACENARVHDGHHPRLALLHQNLITLRGVLPEQHWARTWDKPMRRLENLREIVGPTVFDSALRRATDRDRMIVTHVLNGDVAL